MVRRSALNSAQTSALTSSMISSMLFVAWILLVTAWSCFWNARRAPTSVCVGAWWLRTALIAFLPARTCGTAYSGLYILAAAALIFNEILTFARATFRRKPSRHPSLQQGDCADGRRRCRKMPCKACFGDLRAGD